METQRRSIARWWRMIASSAWNACAGMSPEPVVLSAYAAIIPFTSMVAANLMRTLGERAGRRRC